MKDPSEKIITEKGFWKIEAMRRGLQDFTIVTTNGCFDLLHCGHVKYLQEASKLASLLVVGIDSDSNIKRLKGDSRPIISENERAYMLASLECVGYVFIFDTDDFTPYIDKIRPEVYVKGGDYSLDTINQTERTFIVGLGIKIVLLKHIEGTGTSDIIAKIKA